MYVLKKLLVVDMVGSKPNAKFNRWRSAGSFFPAKRRKNYALVPVCPTKKLSVPRLTLYQTKSGDNRRPTGRRFFRETSQKKFAL